MQITLCGNTLNVSGRILRHYPEIEAEILRRRENPLSILRNVKDVVGSDPDVLRMLTAVAIDKAKEFGNVTRAEIAQFLNTIGGSCFQVWLAVRDNDREKWTLDAVTKIYCDDLEDAVRKSGDKPGAAGDAYERRRLEIEDAINNAEGGEG